VFEGKREDGREEKREEGRQGGREEKREEGRQGGREEKGGSEEERKGRRE